VVYSPLGTNFATTGADGRVRLWDSESGRLVHSFEGQQHTAHFPAFSEDGSRLAAVNGSGGATVWEADSGEALLKLDTESATLSTIAFSPDGSRIAASGPEGVIYVWDAASGNRLLDFAHVAEITRLVYARDGNVIWSYDNRGWARSWDANTGEQVITLGSEHAICDAIVWDAEITPDGRLWGVAGFDGRAHIYRNQETESAVSFSVKAHSLQGHTGNVTGLAFHPRAPLVATSSVDGSSRIWDLNTGEELLNLTGHTSPVQGIDFSPDGRYLATAGADGTVRVYLVSLQELMDMARSRLSRALTTQECQKFLHLPSCPEE
jgi:WD40 repeat protein